MRAVFALVGAAGLLDDGDRAAVERLGARVVAFRAVEARKVVQRDCDIVVIRPARLLVNLQRAIEQRFGGAVVAQLLLDLGQVVDDLRRLDAVGPGRSVRGSRARARTRCAPRRSWRAGTGGIPSSLRKVATASSPGPSAVVAASMARVYDATASPTRPAPACASASASSASA